MNKLKMLVLTAMAAAMVAIGALAAAPSASAVSFTKCIPIHNGSGDVIAWLCP